MVHVLSYRHGCDSLSSRLSVNRDERRNNFNCREIQITFVHVQNYYMTKEIKYQEAHGDANKRDEPHEQVIGDEMVFGTRTIISYQQCGSVQLKYTSVRQGYERSTHPS